MKYSKILLKASFASAIIPAVRYIHENFTGLDTISAYTFIITIKYRFGEHFVATAIDCKMK